MSAICFGVVERQVAEFRQSCGLSDTVAVNLKSLLLKKNVLTVFRPLSDSFSGMSLKSPGGERFMLVNCSHPVCRQRFTIAHELYHLFIERKPVPHKCTVGEEKDSSEKNADAFASRLLMPKDGVLQFIPEEELDTRKVSLATVLRLEQYFAVSRQVVVYRLSDLGCLLPRVREELLEFPVKKTAREHGYGTALYEPGNENLVIGDFGEKARKLFEEEKISEGHYIELLSKIGIDVSES